MKSRKQRIKEGTMIQEALERVGSKKALAELVGVSPRTVRRWVEKGTVPEDKQSLVTRLIAGTDTIGTEKVQKESKIMANAKKTEKAKEEKKVEPCKRHSKFEVIGTEEVDGVLNAQLKCSRCGEVILRPVAKLSKAFRKTWNLELPAKPAKAEKAEETE